MRAVVATALLAAVASATLTDPCSGYGTCATCVSHYLCGWCSEPVVYPGNVSGKQCAGFNPNGPNPFACNGIYSIDECTVGYECDLENFQCVQAGPGKGTTLQKCEANCTNHGQVYLCNHTTMKCREVAPGTSGATSYHVCESACMHPSAHPAPPVSPAPPAQTWSCNHTTGTCDKAKPGHGASKDVCEQECHKENGTKYTCNTLLHKCEKVPDSDPFGKPLAECEKTCNPTPNPGPPPQFLGGTWRGIEIQNGYKIGEWDMKFTDSSVTIIDIAAASTIKGTPFHVQNGENLDLWIKITKGPGAGQTIKAIGKPANRGPETKYLTAAFGAPGADAPSSIGDAMKASSGDKVYFLSQCAGTPECVFTMPSGASLLKRTPLAERLAQRLKEDVRYATDDIAVPVLEAAAARDEPLVVSGAASVDACANYDANCTYCLQHRFCGWCSEPVMYKDGKKGTQCAGFASDPNSTNPFVCKGRYSTLSCSQGYDCDEHNFQCKPNPNPGNGMPIAVCDALCKPTPSPTPAPTQYVCNMTTKQCHKCNETHCAGSMPQATCEAACKKPHKGPTGIVVGIWRGIQIEHGYPLAEFEWVFNASALKVSKNGQEVFTATVTSFGGDVMVFDVKTGTGAGDKLSCLYSVADQGGLYEVMTLAVSKPGGMIPQGYAGPMRTDDEIELVLAKCNQPDCKFTAP